MMSDRDSARRDEDAVKDPEVTSAAEPDPSSSSESEPEAKKPEARKLITNSSGRWVTTPSGQRIFLLDEAPSATPGPVVSSAGAPAGPQTAAVIATPAAPVKRAAPDPPAAPEKRAAPDQSAAPSSAQGPAPDSGSSATDSDDEPWSEASAGLQLETRSEEIEEIISFVPSWMIQWGITVVFGTVVGLLGLAWVVRYPEVVHGTAKVTTPSPPVRLVARVGGEIERLFVRDGDAVAMGAHLAVFRSSADYRDVLKLEERLAELRTSIEEGRKPMDWRLQTSRLSLGDLEVPYSNLLQAIAEYRSFLDDSFSTQVVESLRQQIDDQHRLRASQEKKQRLLAEELRLMERQRDRKEELATSGLLSAQEKDLADSDYLRLLQAAQNAQGELAGTDSRITQIQSSLLEARQRQDEQQRMLRMAVRGAYHALRAAIDRWRQDYLVLAPSPGRVSYFRDLAEGQFLSPFEPIFAVVPQHGDAVATSLLAPAGAGRVKPGQRVILRFDSFPAEEFGTVEGRVESISQLMDQPTDDQSQASYLVRITLPNGLSTTYGKRLEFRQEMGGTADIVTEDLSVLERLFYQLRSVLSSARGS